MDGTAALCVLGVSPGASKQTIKKAFRRLARRVHPDVSGNTEAFVRLKNAYDIAFATAHSDGSVRSGIATTTEAKPPLVKPPLSGWATQLVDGPAAARPGKIRLTQRNAPWLTTVLADFPDTVTYESLLGAVVSKGKVVTESSAARRREADFAEHLATAMANGAQ